MGTNAVSPAEMVSQLGQGRWLIVADTLDSAPCAAAPPVARGLEWIAAVAEGKKILALFVPGVAMICLALSMLFPDEFTATTTLLPPQQSRSSAATVLGQFGDLASLMGKDAARSPNAIFLALLQSRTVADRVIRRFELGKVYGSPRMSRSRQQLKKRTELETTKEGVIVVQVRDQDPRRAANLANGYVEELVHLNQTLAIGEAAQRRAFFEGQVEAARAKLQDAEEQLSQTQKKTGVIQLDAQSKVYSAALAELRALIAVKEVYLEKMRQAATPRNPDVALAETQIAGMRRKLRQLETGGDSPQAQITTSRMAATGLEYLRRLREVKYQEAVLEMLFKQLEAARLDEAKTGALIQVLDRAEVPDHKSGPNRRLITLLGALGGFATGCLTIVLKRQMRRWQDHPDIRRQLDYIKHSLRIAPGPHS